MQTISNINVIFRFNDHSITNVLKSEIDFSYMFRTTIERTIYDIMVLYYTYRIYRSEANIEDL